MRALLRSSGSALILTLAACDASGTLDGGSGGGPCDGGAAAPTWFDDSDGDTLGDATSTQVSCRQPDGFVDNDDDLEPLCSTNDTDDCGICGGGNASMDCEGVCGGEASFDGCGICSGGTTNHDAESDRDCSNECFGSAEVDACGTCAGGSTGIDPSKDPSQCTALPDLMIDGDYLRDDFYVEYLNNVSDNNCWIEEGCVAGPGRRKIVRFGTMIANIGNADLVIGAPSQNNEHFDWSSCHGHYHYSHYANYEVTDAATGIVTVVGHKNGFCVLDLGTYDQDLTDGGCNTYGCGNMGISQGCYDAYWAELECQWVDVTDLPDGEYRLHVTTNEERHMPEQRYDNNVGTVHFQMTGDDVTVLGK